MLRTLFTTLSQSDSMRRFAANFGPARRVARRFTAGEAMDEAVKVTRDLNARGASVALNYLGESVKSEDDARRAAGEYCKLLKRIEEQQLEASVSLKPTHLGLDFGVPFFRKNVASLLEVAAALGVTVEMDMEDSSLVDDTLFAFHALLNEFDSLRIALQACLFRTSEDLKKLIDSGSSVRLVKGAYDEPAAVAWKRKKDVDSSYARLVEESFAEAARASGFYPAFGTHDHVLIEKIQAEAARRGVDRDRFEFQMLLGVRRDWQQRLVDEGFRLRIYVPFGTQWYPYFMRRLAERPANVLFAMRAMAGR